MSNCILLRLKYLQYRMSYHKTSLTLTTEDREFLDAKCISLTKLVRTNIQKLKEESASVS